MYSLYKSKNNFFFPFFLFQNHSIRKVGERRNQLIYGFLMANMVLMSHTMSRNMSIISFNFRFLIRK